MSVSRGRNSRIAPAALEAVPARRTAGGPRSPHREPSPRPGSGFVRGPATPSNRPGIIELPAWFPFTVCPQPGAGRNARPQRFRGGSATPAPPSGTLRSHCDCSTFARPAASTSPSRPTGLTALMASAWLSDLANSALQEPPVPDRPAHAACSRSHCVASLPHFCGFAVSGPATRAGRHEAGKPVSTCRSADEHRPVQPTSIERRSRPQVSRPRAVAGHCRRESKFGSAGPPAGSANSTGAVRRIAHERKRGRGRLHLRTREPGAFPARTPRAVRRSCNRQAARRTAA